MKVVQCKSCGSTELKKEGSYWICQHCGSKNYFTKDELPAHESEIALNDDVKRLLERWDNDPTNARKYAKLILQIDPNNERALREFKGNSSSGCYIATAVYGSYDCPEVWTLRRYRDFVLAKTLPGRMFIKTYYSVSPKLVKAYGKNAWFVKFWRSRLDKMVKKLNRDGFENTPYRDN